MGAAVLLRDDDGRVLLVEPAYKDYWELPGGAVDADESPYDAAARELKEELGLPVAPERLLVVDWVPPRTGRTEGVMFVYDGGVVERGEQPHIGPAAGPALLRMPCCRWTARRTQPTLAQPEVGDIVASHSGRPSRPHCGFWSSAP